MADVQNVITLGIGSAPGKIAPFVLFGLDTAIVTPSMTRTYVVAADDRTGEMDEESRGYIVAAETRSFSQ